MRAKKEANFTALMSKAPILAEKHRPKTNNQQIKHIK